MMASTHAAYGFVASYAITLLFVNLISPATYAMVVPATAWLVIAGMVGGVFPDLDQLQFWGPPWLSRHFVHKKTCHFISGYFMATALLLATAALVPNYVIPLVVLACATMGAGVHSFMDPFDGWNDKHPKWGIWEHIRGQWIASKRWIMFAGLWEWVIQAFATIWFILISASLSPLTIMIWRLPGWEVTAASYGSIWAISAFWDAREAPKRQGRERRLIRAIRRIK
jgi:hypothetical protein